MKTQIHDEGSHQAAALFLDGWLPVAVRGLTAVLGQTPEPAVVHVVLSTTVDHHFRFPPRRNDLEALMGTDAENPSVPLGQRFPVETYAHGVAALCDPIQKPPKGIPDGEPVIYLDIPTIALLAAKHRVSDEAMLGRVIVHELSHALRGHAQKDGRATHGYIREGDAQRDAWQVLLDLLADPEWEYLALEARVAQVCLSTTQPAAYRQFGQGSPDTGRWIQDDCSPPSNWTLRPPRCLLPLSRHPVIEVPIHASSSWFTPTVGDHVYLLGENLIVGPWVVVGRAKAPHAAHRIDLRAIEIEKSDRSRSHRPPEWLHLRCQRDMRACTDPDSRLTLSAKMLCKKIEGDDVTLLRARADRWV